MFAYILRRILYSIPIVLGVNLITFTLFFFVNSPDDMARQVLGEKRVTQDRIDEWKVEHGYHLPRIFNWDNASLEHRNVYFWRILASRLYNESPEQDPTPARYIWSRLSPEVHGLIEEVSLEVSTDPKVMIPKEERIVAGLNRLIDQSQFARYALFEDPELNIEEEGLLEKEEEGKLTDREERRLNRLFLERAFPDALAKGVPLEYGFACITQTIFWRKNAPLLRFDFGVSDLDGTSIGQQIRTRMIPSLSITIPLFLIPIWFSIALGMLVAFYRGTYVDYAILLVCVLMMSIPGLFYIITGQIFFAKYLKLVPISGYVGGLVGIPLLLLPILIGFIRALPGSVRYNRTLFLEEINKDYVRTARAKGLGEGKVLFKHALKNAMIPILTGLVMAIPFLIIGNLMLEQFFSIPGLGNFMIEALNQQDFAVIRAMVYLISVFNVIGLLLVDISYTIVDPRIRLG